MGTSLADSRSSQEATVTKVEGVRMRERMLREEVKEVPGARSYGA